MLAAMRPFHKVIGVESNAGLLSIARENLARVQKRLRFRDVALVHVDAARSDVPDDVNVVFLFNPFDGDVREAVISRIADSLKRIPRRITERILVAPQIHSLTLPSTIPTLLGV